EARVEERHEAVARREEREEAPLPLEAREALGLDAREELERDRLPRRRAGAVDDAHAALAERLEQLVGADLQGEETMPRGRAGRKRGVSARRGLLEERRAALEDVPDERHGLERGDRARVARLRGRVVP